MGGKKAKESKRRNDEEGNNTERMIKNTEEKEKL